MSNHSSESVSQLVLDNRKLILGFALLIVVCGGFFVIGFMEGKRQGLLRAGEKNPENQTARRDSGMQPPAAKPAVTLPSESPAEDKDVRDRLDWYGSVNKPGESGVKGLEPNKGASPAPLLLPARKPGTTPSAVTERASSKVEPESKPPRTAQPAAISYSVQVGAFRQRKEAEAKAAVLQSKKYACVIEPSGGPDGLYLLKVGKYESRADAIAMQNRLKKDGFTTFIKTNK